MFQLDVQGTTMKSLLKSRMEQDNDATEPSLHSQAEMLPAIACEAYDNAVANLRTSLLSRPTRSKFVCLSWCVERVQKFVPHAISHLGNLSDRQYQRY